MSRIMNFMNNGINTVRVIIHFKVIKKANKFAFLRSTFRIFVIVKYHYRVKQRNLLMAYSAYLINLQLANIQ